MSKREIYFDVVEIGRKYAVRQTTIISSFFGLIKDREVEFLDTQYANDKENIRFAGCWSTLSAVTQYCLFDSRADAATLCLHAETISKVIEELRR